MPSEEHRRLVQMLSVRRKDSFDLASFRSDFERFASLFKLPDSVSLERLELGGVACQQLVPAGAVRERLVVYVHGGGFVSGSLATHREVMARLAEECCCPVLGVGYRRAPEHPYPAGLEDVLTVLRSISEGGLGQSLQGLRSVAIAGDSAGACLALSALQRRRDVGEPLPLSLVLFSPWVDLAATGESIKSRAHQDKILQPVVLRRTAQLYLDGVSPTDPEVSPLFGNLGGLPPTLIQVGTGEILLDDARRLDRRLRLQGGEVTLKVWEGMVHVWHLYASLIPEGGLAIQEAADFLRSRFEP